MEGFTLTKRKFGLALALVLVISGCSELVVLIKKIKTKVLQAQVKLMKTDFSIAMVTDVGGVDDKSFNQSAWEGIQAWGEETWS